MKDREQRLRSIGYWAIPPKWSPDYQRVIDFLSSVKTPQTSEYVKQACEIASATVAVTNWNSSKLPMSEALRYYFGEYNSRAFSHGLWVMPTSFAFAECFFEYRPELNYFKLKPERDYIFSFTHFIDWLTSVSEENTLEHMSLHMDEGVIYSFNVSEHPKVFEFSMKCGNTLCVAGASLIRSGSEIVVFLLGGESGKQEDIEKYRSITSHFGKEQIKPDATLQFGRVMLNGVSDRQRILAITRFDLADKTSCFRYYAEDLGNGFLSYTDDIETLKLPDGTISEQLTRVYENSKNTLDERQAAFELCKTLMILPQFAATHSEMTKLQSFQTELKSKQKSLKHRKLIERAEPYSKVFLREVREISSPQEFSFGSSVTISTPAYTNKTDGYWKSLLPWEIGIGKNKQSTKGRTWIEISNETPPTNTSPNGSAVSESYIRGSFANHEAVPAGPNYGFIYVMRNPQYERDIYKIGLTKRTPDVRANDLSRTSGVIDYFAVMQDWEVTDCTTAEKEIHKRLASFRVTDRREFFKAPYKEIFSVIHDVVETINNAAKAGKKISFTEK